MIDMYIGIDVGGTAVKAGVVDGEGRVLSRAEVKSEPASDAAMLRAMYSAMLRAMEGAGLSKDDVSAVGIGSSGICDNAKGTIIYSGNIAYDNTAVREFFSERINARIDVENDVNCAAIGEYALYGGGADSFVFVALGTGVGGGIIINKRLYSGLHGGAGEVGHMTLVPGGRLCGCGARGCWEAYASVSALISDARERGGCFSALPAIDGKAVFDAAERGLPEAVEVRDGWIRRVAEGVCSLVNILRPEKLVIGGAVSRQGETLLAPIRRYVAENAYANDVPGIGMTEISAARLMGDAGIVGAAMLHKLV